MNEDSETIMILILIFIWILIPILALVVQRIRRRMDFNEIYFSGISEIRPEMPLESISVFPKGNGPETMRSPGRGDPRMSWRDDR